MAIDVLVIGSGGREHALCWKVSQSPLLGKLYAAPGNAGIAQVCDEVFPISIPPFDMKPEQWQAYKLEIGALCLKLQPALVVVGPEVPLIWGITDYLEGLGFLVFGPSKAAAEIEGSKIFSHEFMVANRIATPAGEAYFDFDQAAKALKIIRALKNDPIVIKADGPAAGKGVRILKELEDALQALQGFMVEDLLGESGRKVLIQEYIAEAREASLHGFADGWGGNVLPMPLSRDYKAKEAGSSELTGGMGAYSPLPEIHYGEVNKFNSDFLNVPVKAMRDSGRPFKGIFYPALMMTSRWAGCIEVNARGGDPEMEALMPRLKSDLLEIMLSCAREDGSLAKIRPDWDQQACVAVVICSGGYPGTYKTGLPIFGIEDAQALGVEVFHNGTKMDNDQLVTSGGRVLTVTALGATLEAAREKAYEGVHCIYFEGHFSRPDIAQLN